MTGQRVPQPQISEMTALEVLREIDRIAPLGDRIYQVREAAIAKDPGWDPNASSWGHPEVVRYGELCTRVKVLIEEDK